MIGSGGAPRIGGPISHLLLSSRDSPHDCFPGRVGGAEVDTQVIIDGSAAVDPEQPRRCWPDVEEE